MRLVLLSLYGVSTD